MKKDLQVIDLFSGVGGLSLSAEMAGFKLVAAVEREKRIIDCHEKNFPNSIHICKDISLVTGSSLKEEATKLKSELAGVIGGPPCQGFSTIGKRNVDDERNQLFAHFFELVRDLRPAFYLAENVPGILNIKYAQIRSRALQIVEPDYDVLPPFAISANELGGVTTRKRVFFIGIRKDIKTNGNIFEKIQSLKTKGIHKVKDALDGLPISISEKWQSFDSSWRKISILDEDKYSSTQNKIIDGIGNAVSIERLISKNEVSGSFGTRHSIDTAKRYNILKPGETDKVSRSQRLDLEGFCPTLRAGTDNTRGSYQAVRPIHPSKARVITPREAARLQGFPDWFQFHETKWHSFRMIGNSVCPIAASKILNTIKENISI